ncbi:MAG: transketolase [Parcubacteria group bacterium Gr01-1014_20]|nr:MAG: transketolase [Parcubacteria group bacterium Gr01-1014_20]
MPQEDLKGIRLNILEMVSRAGEGHIPSALSVVELLYSIHLNKTKNDQFFLSKGHASAALYAVLAHFGYITKSELDTFCKYDSVLGGHPHKNPEIGILNSSGSLGHGFPIAAGYALSKKIKNEPGRVFCIIGDGETNEGTIWETAMYAEQLKLLNLVAIIDNNKSQTRAMTSINLKDKFLSFGWEVREINGHDLSEIAEVLFNKNNINHPKPLCVIANTTKGKGIREMESNFFTWHHKAPTELELEMFKKEVLK